MESVFELPIRIPPRKSGERLRALSSLGERDIAEGLVRLSRAFNCGRDRLTDELM